MTATEGRLPFRGYDTWYRVVGETEQRGRMPLLALHGGPGGSHDPLEGLGALAEQGRRVVFYDQLGGGDSDKPDDPSLWTVETFLEQLRSVRERPRARAACTSSAPPGAGCWRSSMRSPSRKGS